MKVKLTDALTRFCAETLPNTPLLISSPDASDLFVSDPRATEMTPLVPAFLANLDQASRLKAGAVHSTVMWLSSEIVYQTHKEGLVFSALLADNANIGLVDQELSALATAIKPMLLLSESCSIH